jgi:hypothetical protein
LHQHFVLCVNFGICFCCHDCHQCDLCSGKRKQYVTIQNEFQDALRRKKESNSTEEAKDVHEEEERRPGASCGMQIGSSSSSRGVTTVVAFCLKRGSRNGIIA